ncbi:hypothetical protein Ancab_011078 [Ancistrocladus abbreviatus]
MNSVETSEVIQERGKSKRIWTQEEVQALVESLHELSVDAQWKGENDFKIGYLVRLEEMLHQKDHKDANDMLLEVYGSDRANGQDVETFFDAINNMEKSMETQKRNFEFDVDLDEEEFSSTQRKTFEYGDSIRAAVSLTAEPNKLVIFYQLPPQLRRQYVVNNILCGGPGY